MTIAFDLEEKDYIDYSHYFVKKKLKRLQISLIFFFAALCYLLFLQFQNGARTAGDYFTLPVIFLALYLVLILFAWSRWNTGSKVRKLLKSGRNAGVLGHRTLTFSEANLLVQNEFEESKLKWDAFEYLKESDKHLFLFQTVNQAIIIPKRIFLLDQEQYEVRSFIERKLLECNRKPR